MRELRSVTGRAVVLDRADVDTDQIIPKQFLKRIERTGYGEFLFFDWMRDPEFVLNRPESRGAPILIAGRNFGCGSSREHAAWALEDFGFRVVIAPSFGDIFRTNAVNSGLAPVALPPADVAALRDAVAQRNELTVDLERLEIAHPDGLRVSFPFDAHSQETLVNGLDDIARTLQRAAAIDAFEETYTPRFDRYDTIIIDEAHERSLNIDFLLGYLRRLLPRRPDLKLIITSATIDPQRFAAHFAEPDGTPAPIVEVSGRTYPVEVRYRPLEVRARRPSDTEAPRSRPRGGAPEAGPDRGDRRRGRELSAHARRRPGLPVR